MFGMNQAVILDISSDDEVGFDDSSTADNFDWVSKFFEDVPSKDDVNCTLDVASNCADADSDDVVVVGEVLVKPKRAKVSVARYRNDSYNDDDDCVVLNYDPDNRKNAPPSVPGLGQDKGSDEDSDDLVIVGEKGQVACRDYPHSRHLCAKFPFGSTPQSSHCDLCHCYVCDSPAPCAHWGSGDLALDHCCATDKLEYWKLERKNKRESKNPPAPIAKPAADSLSRFGQLQQTSAQPTSVLRPASACGVSSSFGVPNIISHSRIQGPSITRSRFQSHQVRGQPLRACNITQSHRNSMAPSLASSRSVFKSSGFTARAGVVNRSAYVPPNNSTSYWQQMLDGTLVGKSAEINSINLTEISPHSGVNISSNPPIVSSISTGTLPSHTQSYNNSVSLTPTPHFPGYGQSTAGTADNPWAYATGSQIQSGSWPVMHCNSSNAANGVTSGSQQSSAVIQNATGPSFPGNTSDGLSSIAPRIHQPSEAARNFSCAAYPYNTSDSTSSIAQSYQQLSAEKRQIEGAVPRNELLPSIEHNPQISCSMSSSSLGFDLDCWLPENDPILGVQDGSDLFNMSNQPSVAVDAGMLLFDFETSWKGLAHS